MSDSIQVEPSGQDAWRFVFPPRLRQEEPELAKVCRLVESGQEHQAFYLLKDLLTRCPDYIEAHNRMAEFHSARGNFQAAFDHYRDAVRVGRGALPKGFDGMLPYGTTTNQPFLRALHGLALVSVRLGKGDEGADLLRRLLELDPADPLGAGATLSELETQGAPPPAAPAS